MDDLFSVPAMSLASPQKPLNPSFQDWNPFDATGNAPSGGFQVNAGGTTNTAWVGFEQEGQSLDPPQPLQSQPDQWIQFNEPGPSDLLGGNSAPVHQDLMFSNPQAAR